METCKTLGVEYGCDEFGRLTSVLMHRPGKELELIGPENHQSWLFDAVPEIGLLVEEYDRYRELLAALGVRVFELTEHLDDHQAMISRMPNLMYMHDTAVISRKGAIISSMAMEGRRDEHRVVRAALRNMGVPILYEFEEAADAFEGCLLLGPDTILVAETERHSATSVEKFVRDIRRSFEEVLWVKTPRSRRFMHPDTIFNRVKDDLALAYLPAFISTRLFDAAGEREVDFSWYMRRRGVEVLEVSDDEQKRLACSFVPLEPGVMIHYDTALDRGTVKRLERRGVELVLFHPNHLNAGGGSLRCLTLRLHRTAAG